MGYVFHGLIPPALLLDNPGVAREDLAALLNQTHSYGKQFSKEDPWDFPINTHAEDINYHTGLRAVAILFRLPYREEFKQFQEDTSTKDSSGIALTNPWLSLEINPAAPSEPLYNLGIHTSNRTAKPFSMQVRDASRYKIGSTIGIPDDLAWDTDTTDGIVLDINNSLHLNNPRLTVLPYRRIFQFQEFTSEEKLVQAWPQFETEAMYDFSPKAGSFREHEVKGFRWKREGNRYFLDPATFEHIPDSFYSNRSLQFGYQDLILTAEAIKNNAWKLFSFQGMRHQEQFFHDFPGSLSRYEKAVWDGTTSLYARSEGMTNTEFMRARLQQFRR